MRKNILVVSTSLHKGSNSELLADKFINGAKEAGHHVEKISLKDKKIAFCHGCLACQHTGKCVLKDDGNEIADKMLVADVIVFATPIYYYEMSGQMKTMLDRANPLYFADYKFRDVYLLASAADEDEHAVEAAVKGLSGWISCFTKATLIGQRDTRSEKSKFVPLLRYFHSAYVQYASFKCLAGTQIYLFSTLRPQILRFA